MSFKSKAVLERYDLQTRIDLLHFFDDRFERAIDKTNKNQHTLRPTFTVAEVRFLQRSLKDLLYKLHHDFYGNDYD